jgi:MoxR-like ATPase
VAALERQAERAAALEKRVRELEAENRRLRAAVDARGAAATAGGGADHSDRGDLEGIYLDAKLRDYMSTIVAGTRSPADFGLTAYADAIVSGARPDDVAAFIDAAKAHAQKEERKYVLPSDIAEVAVDVLRSRVILSGEAEARGVDVDDLVRELLEQVEVP